MSYRRPSRNAFRLSAIAVGLLASGVALSLSACFNDPPPIDLTGLCTYNTDPQAERCKPGQMAWFRPDQGALISEEMALSVAAASITQLAVHMSISCPESGRGLHYAAGGPHEHQLP